MEKTRVHKGEGYWFIFRTKGGGFVVNYKIEEGSSDDDARFDIGNYFVVRDEALFMARKLRAVLKGAKVIEQNEEMVYAKPIDAFYIRPSVENYRTPR